MKNIIIAILAIALGISGYFNYQIKQEDSKAFKIRPGKDSIKITLYGINKEEDSLAQLKGEHAIPKAFEAFLMKTIDCSCIKKDNTSISGICDCDPGVVLKEIVKPDPGVEPKPWPKFDRVTYSLTTVGQEPFSPSDHTGQPK